jgi:calcineurin-like phosphoesterase
MKILFIGDIVGRPGRNAVKAIMPELKEQNNLDLVLANGENLASVIGMTNEK